MMKTFFQLTIFIIIILISNSIYDKSFSIGNFNYTGLTNVTDLDISKLTYDINSNPFNISYSDWTTKWWQWAYSVSSNANPSYDDTGKYCSQNQDGPVWYLTLSYKHPVTRICDIPENTSLLITLLNSECSFAEFPLLKTENELRECARSMQDIVTGGNASINGIDIPNKQIYQVKSDLFNFTLPINNILNLPSQTTQAISDGIWVFLKPLLIGNYELKFKGNIKIIANNHSNGDLNKYDEFAGPLGWNYTTTYLLSVKNNVIK